MPDSNLLERLDARLRVNDHGRYSRRFRLVNSRLFPARRSLVLNSLAACSILLTQGASAAQLDEKTGLALTPGFEVVSAQCTVCHSARLITQNRASREGWLDMIRWMQQTQGLWPLGDNEDQVLDYLAANYGPEAAGRRRPLPPELMPPP